MPKFTPGQSGNPKGRPPGVADRRTALRRQLEEHGPALMQRAVELAMAGDVAAMRLCLERVAPPVREEPVRFDLPPVETAADVQRALGAVVAAVAAGDLLPSQGDALAGLLEAHRKALETGELSARLERIEAALAARGGSK